jgi:uncharacterized membrane protein YoaK (UPF0700 family)
MQTNSRKWLPDDGSLTVFTLCFVGGCMDCVSYLLLFHVLLGVMTVNTMIGIVGIIDHKNIHDALLHLSTVIGFLIMVLAHNLLVFKHTGAIRSMRTVPYLAVELVLIVVYACVASELYRHGQLQKPDLIAFALVCLGSFAIYLQNSVVPQDRSFPTSTMVMTGNYISLLTHSLNMLLRSDGKEEARQAVKHFSLVHAHFWGGVALMAYATQYFDFLALMLPCMALGLLILRLRSSSGRASDFPA